MAVAVAAIIAPFIHASRRPVVALPKGPPMTVIAVARPATNDLQVVYELRDAFRPDGDFGWSGEYRILWGSWGNERSNWMGPGFFGDDRFTFTEFSS